MDSASPELRIGTSGYQYRHWKGLFYPEGLPASRWFAHYAESFDTVEINNTFYHLPPESAFEKWRERAPNGFVYALKFSRYATHMKKLKEPEEPLKLFLDRADRLQDHLGPILVQLPPHWKADVERLAGFLAAAPRKYRLAVEFRDRSWLNEEVFGLLREHGAALCFHDLIPDHPWIPTADWAYIRFHGGRSYSNDYSRDQLQGITRDIRKLLDAGMDTYVYFNNDVLGHAIHNALDLRRLLTDSESARAA